jgi:hypothetical protein
MRLKPIYGKASWQPGARRKQGKQRSVRARVLSALFLAFVLLCVALFVRAAVHGQRNFDEWQELVVGAGFMATLLLFALAANTWGTRWAGLFGAAGLSVFAADLLGTATVMIADPWSAIDYGRRGKVHFDSPGEVVFFGVICGSFGVLLLTIWAGIVHTWWQEKRVGLRSRDGRKLPNADSPGS